MSNEEQSINHFERMLESVSAAEPKGNAMQIMYLAGQQSAQVPAKGTSSHRLWKWTTLLSSSIAAGLMILLASQDRTPDNIPGDVQVASNAPLESESKASPQLRISDSKLTSQPRKQKSVDRLFDPLAIANASRNQRSIDLFDEFEIRPFKMDGSKREYQQ